MQKDLRDAAVEEVVAEYKASLTQKPEVDFKADAMKEAMRLNETNKAIDAAHAEVEQNRDAYAEVFRKKANEEQKKKTDRKLFVLEQHWIVASARHVPSFGSERKILATKYSEIGVENGQRHADTD